MTAATRIQVDRPELAIIGDSPGIRRAVSLARLYGPSLLPVLILGETGTGKELIAQLVHQASLRSGPLVDINCAAIPGPMFESLLFGHRRGAFTGAIADSQGLLLESHRGTLFLDELTSLPDEGQAKLLRVLETGELRWLGETGKRGFCTMSGNCVNGFGTVSWADGGVGGAGSTAGFQAFGDYAFGKQLFLEDGGKETDWIRMNWAIDHGGSDEETQAALRRELAFGRVHVGDFPDAGFVPVHPQPGRKVGHLYIDSDVIATGFSIPNRTAWLLIHELTHAYDPEIRRADYLVPDIGTWHPLLGRVQIEDPTDADRRFARRCQNEMRADSRADRAIGLYRASWGFTRVVCNSI